MHSVLLAGYGNAERRRDQACKWHSHETARFFFFSRFLGKLSQVRSEREAVIHAQRGALLEKGVG